LQIPVPVGLSVLACLNHDLAIGHHEPYRPRVRLAALAAGGGQLDRRAILDASERGCDLAERRLAGGQRQPAEQQGRDQRPHQASFGRRNDATRRFVSWRGTNRIMLAMTLFIAPFTSTGPCPMARTAWSATASADIQAKPGMTLTSTA